ncbi:MAG: tRNA lysidine(34) synthetase TilS [Lentimicrobiaceae bacterium]|nr:tRNA lysidine(34) synthetase TilS [Lentimicrobiaceae bacterium]
MIRDFIKYVKTENLFQKQDKLLVGVSGGVDSVVLLNILVKLNYNVSVAHVNFNLRGNDSHQDYLFVEKMAKSLSVPFFFKNADTHLYMKQHKLTLQEAAREIRYDWFNQLISENNFFAVLTAHHLNDQFETQVINLLRGTGFKGLRAMLPKQNNIIRPLLFATSEMIRQYATENNLPWREDISNQSDDYLRNYIRHNVLPLLLEVSPNLLEIAEKNAQNFRDAELILENHINQVKNQVFVEENGITYIDLDKIKNLEPVAAYMYYLLKDFGFNKSQTDGIVQDVETTSGRCFSSATHTLLCDRNSIIIKPIETNEKFVTETYNSIDELLSNKSKVIDFKQIAYSEIKDLKNKNQAFLDISKIKFPVTIRHWQQGDKFIPFGSKNFKKLSDFFIDNKLSLFEKEEILLLTSGDDIAWIIGMRTDERYRVTHETEKVLQCSVVSD